MTKVNFRLNGEDISVTLDDPEMPLVFLLREKLGLTGTKYACLEGQCGACTVHVDGQATRSCITPASAVEGSSVTTIEGLSADASHPVQQAWIEHRVPQCGYCQSGQIMQAAAFLSGAPEPDADAIADAMSGNLCRCGTGQRILKAVGRAAEIAREAAQ
ncbi:MAG: (2Fe-2S)-binding protein [Hyphomicrobiales bacterium]|nr:MAG: (2Fe-2S)-binding protein [Hyphomicrobiales bacterium]